MEGWARDISETGLSAFAARSLMVGEVVTLEIPVTPLRRLRIPAKVVRCVGTQYGFQFMALSPDQRADIQSAVKNRPEIGSSDQMPGSTLRKDESEIELSTPEGTRHNIDRAFADRAHMLIKRGYTPKVAVELVLHELEVEYGSNSRKMDEARRNADDFLSKVRRGLL
jgi:hypothetical protein